MEEMTTARYGCGTFLPPRARPHLRLPAGEVLRLILLSQITCFTGTKVQIMTQLEARVGRLGSLGRVALHQQQRPRQQLQQLQHQQDRRQHARAPVSQQRSADHADTQCSRELESSASGRRSGSASVVGGAGEGRHQFDAGNVLGGPLSSSTLSSSPRAKG